MNVTVVDPVAPKTLTGIELTGTYKTEYTVGESFSTEGMVVKSVYSNGDKEAVAIGEVTFTGYNMNQSGYQTVTATWSGYSTTFQIHVSEAQQTQYTVTFSAGEGSGTMDPVQVNEGEQYTLPQNGFTAPEGKEFDCWVVNGVEYQPGATITVTGDVTVTAKWKAVETPVEPSNNNGGLPTGAVVGIVIGSAVVVGIGGFALVWFVIKKKTWADFLALFKKK